MFIDPRFAPVTLLQAYTENTTQYAHMKHVQPKSPTLVKKLMRRLVKTHLPSQPLIRI